MLVLPSLIGGCHIGRCVTNSFILQVSVPEGMFPPFDVLGLTATDVDTNRNGRIEYRLVDDDDL